ncbi:CubicO group peptidase (beta-lactamase class C family) [Alkalihalobacillus xiaoxiensis]|uniref:CubicO group peptidase (Beta-lactamase class C family) n=1 Tax=Shouchella xiaoxiensis TaxID=766895 RepID=A0ABS2SS95_9BACI|nr:serine hydrolase domain-containing protein [Shouchella xiaoxiensis]MBM7837866.1 CubicO group peptidase (beta-lactamase class C family) [Shouchella xiaoxiensis]
MKSFIFGLIFSIVLVVNPFQVTAASTPSGIPLEELETFVDQFASEHIGQKTVGASVVVLKDGDIVLSKGYGQGDVANNVPIDVETSVFEWGSISKLFVYVAVMQLVEQEQLDLQEDIRAYLPEDFLTRLQFDEPITLMHLINHQAGFEDYVFDLGYSEKRYVESLEDGLRRSEPKQIYPPGDVVAYSNYSNALAGYIVERVTGQPFYEYVEDQIFSTFAEPVEAAFVPNDPESTVETDKVNGYLRADLGEFIEGDPFYVSIYPAGGLNGTALDLAQFALALLPEDGESLLFEEGTTLEELLTQTYALTEDFPGLAHGFWEFPGSSRSVGHGGNTAAFSSNLQLVPEERFAVIVLTNQGGELHFTQELTSALIGLNSEKDSEALPDTQEISGSFQQSRKMDSSFIRLYYSLLKLTVEPNDSESITVNFGGEEAIYQQIRPYVYAYEEGSPLFLTMPYLHTEVEDGQLLRISSTGGYFLLEPPSNQVLMVVLFATCVYFIVATVVLLITWLIRRIRRSHKTSSNAFVGLHLVSFALVINVGVMAFRMLTNSARRFSEFYAQIGLNYALILVALVFVYFCIRSLFKNEHRKGALVLKLISLVLFVLLVMALVYWRMLG